MRSSSNGASNRYCHSAAWSALGQQQFYDRQEGSAVIQIDTTVSPPATRVVMIGGGVSGAPVARNPQSAETIDLTQLAPTPAWARMPDMSFARTNVTAVLLPDGTIFVVGGQRAGKWAADPRPCSKPRSSILRPTAGPSPRLWPIRASITLWLCSYPMDG